MIQTGWPTSLPARLPPDARCPQVLKLGRTLAFTECRLFTPTGELMARGGHVKYVVPPSAWKPFLALRPALAQRLLLWFERTYAGRSIRIGGRQLDLRETVAAAPDEGDSSVGPTGGSYHQCGAQPLRTDDPRESRVVRPARLAFTVSTSCMRPSAASVLHRRRDDFRRRGRRASRLRHAAAGRAAAGSRPRGCGPSGALLGPACRGAAR